MAGTIDLHTTTLNQLLQNPEARAIVDELVPELWTHPMLGMAKGMPVSTVLSFASAQLDPALVAKLTERLAAL